MAKSSGFMKRFPHAGIFFVIAVAFAIPLTTWSLNNVSTQTEQHAACNVIGICCNTAPKWTLVSHTDYATSVKFLLTLSSTCPNASVDPGGLVNEFTLWAKVPTGWSYQYNISGCMVNKSCDYTVYNRNSASVYVTIKRPSTANLGTYTIPLYAKNFLSPTGTRNLSYIVTK